MIGSNWLRSWFNASGNSKFSGKVPVRRRLALKALEDRLAPAGNLVADINPQVTDFGSNPNNFFALDGVVYFSATDGTTGYELWKTDGTAAGTGLVKNINASPYGYYGPSYMENVGGTLYFSANNGVNGYGLWKSDGTESGTVMVKVINTGPYGGEPYSGPRNLTDVNGTLFFAAYSPSSGRELWKSDGTEAGTVLVKNIHPSVYGYSGATDLTNVNGTLFFAADNGNANGYELWKSDGTEAGTVMVKDILAGSGSSAPAQLTLVDDTLFFVATSSANGSELWKTDGTEAGTVLVKDIRPGAADSSPYFLTNVDGTLYFRANDGTNGYELWRSDGTAAGTTLVKDIRAGTADSSPSQLTNVNNRLFFTADDGANGSEIWMSDGTLAGTTLVKDILPGSNGSAPSDLTDVNGTLFFVADDGVNGREVWKTFGTAAGTVLDTELVPGASGGDPRNLTALGNMLLFSAADSTHGREVWRSIAPPTVTIGQALGQSDPVTSGTISFDVQFSVDVTGFDAADVDLSSSTVAGTLTPTVTQITPSAYRVDVTGMFGSGQVIASIQAGAALDGLGNPNEASLPRDNSVTYNGAGTISLGAPVYAAIEGAVVIVTVSRTGGAEGFVSVNYDLNDVSALAGSDYEDLTGTLTWADGELGDRTIAIAVTDDNLNEGDETFAVKLTIPAGLAGPPQTDLTDAQVIIAKSDPKLEPTVKGTSIFTFEDVDGDSVTIKLIQPKELAGELIPYLTNDTGPIQRLEFSGTNAEKSNLSVTVKKAAGGDGMVEIGAVVGSGLKSLNLSKSQLTGEGINLTGMVQNLTLDRVSGGADIITTGAPIDKKATSITVKNEFANDGVNGTDIKLNAPLKSMKAASFGTGLIEAPSIGTMTIKGNFAADIHVSGAGLDPVKDKAIKTLKISGEVRDSDILVGSNVGVGFSGNVGSVTVGSFINSRLFANFLGSDDGAGANAFNTAIPATISSFKTTLKAVDAFVNSSVIASVIKTVTLSGVQTDNSDEAFGIFADVSFKTVSMKLPTKNTAKNSLDLVIDDFRVQIV